MTVYTKVIFFVLLLNTAQAQTGDMTLYEPVVPNKIQDAFTPAASRFSGLLNGHIILNLEKRLLQVDSATMLAGFEHRPGEQTWIGEHAGKFLFSASRTYRYTHDNRLKQLMDAVAQRYISTQLPDGYLGTYLPANYWTEWDVWAHKYAIIGLLGYYEVTGSAPALDAAKKAADLICKTFGDGPGKKDINKAGEHAGLAPGSILEAMIDLYRYTADKKHLAFAKYILRHFESAGGAKIMTVLRGSGNVTKIGDAKAYEMLCCFDGILKYYRLTGEAGYLEVLEKTWQDIVTNRLYITGTASSFEIFHRAHALPAGNKDDMGEGCVTVTWMQFNEQLLKITGNPKYAEALEKSVYNHLLAAESPQTGCVSYYTALQDAKPYKCNQNFSCCLSSIPGGISMIPGLIWGRLKQGFAVLMYEAGEASDSIIAEDRSSTMLHIKAATNFPADGNIKYTISPSSEKKFSITFRIPSWSAAYQLFINGVRQNTNNPNMIRVTRLWKAGDEVIIHFNMPLRIIHGAPSYPGCIAFKRGPQVLAVDSLCNGGYKNKLLIPADRADAFTITDAVQALPQNWIGQQAYAIKVKDNPSMTSLLLVPFADAGQLGGGIRVWIK